MRLLGKALPKRRNAFTSIRIDLTVIALWLGHENINTTHKYMEADLEMKKKTLSALNDPNQKMKKHNLPDGLIKFLEGL